MKVENLAPLAGYQHFGTVKIDGKTQVMTVEQRNIKGNIIYFLDLDPEV